jgi:hypothetical protein
MRWRSTARMDARDRILLGRGSQKTLSRNPFTSFSKSSGLS